jgi:hypothetical protein
MEVRLGIGRNCFENIDFEMERASSRLEIRQRFYSGQVSGFAPIAAMFLVQLIGWQRQLERSVRLPRHQPMPGPPLDRALLVKKYQRVGI